MPISYRNFEKLKKFYTFIFEMCRENHVSLKNVSDRDLEL